MPLRHIESRSKSPPHCHFAGVLPRFWCADKFRMSMVIVVTVAWCEAVVTEVSALTVMMTTLAVVKLCIVRGCCFGISFAEPVCCREIHAWVGQSLPRGLSPFSPLIFNFWNLCSQGNGKSCFICTFQHFAQQSKQTHCFAIVFCTNLTARNNGKSV